MKVVVTTRKVKATLSRVGDHQCLEVEELDAKLDQPTLNLVLVVDSIEIVDERGSQAAPKPVSAAEEKSKPERKPRKKKV